MIMHAIPINCLSTNPPTCSTRYEWRDIEEVEQNSLALVENFKYNKADGPYIPIKF